jgi:hypothetical protein
MIFRAHLLLVALQNRNVDGNPVSCPLSLFDGSYLLPTHPLFESFFSLCRSRGLPKKTIGGFLTAEKVFILHILLYISCKKPLHLGV